MSSNADRLFLFSIATSLYHASRMFCSSISQFYLYSLGFDTALLFKLYAFHAIMISLVNLPVSFYADAFSKRKIVFFGLGCVCFNYFAFWLLGPLSKSTWRVHCISIVYFAEIVYALGREMINSALDAWFVSEIAEEDRDTSFSHYTHTTQSYTPLFSLLSALGGVALSFFKEFSFCYLLSFISLLAVVVLFAYIAKTAPNKALSNDRCKDTFFNTSSIAWQETRTFSEKLRALIVPYWKIFASISGSLALFSFVAFSFARWITFHFWQSTFLGRVPKQSLSLPLNFVTPLIGYTLAMYLGQYISNRFLKRERAFSTSYFRKGFLVMMAGSFAAFIISLSSGYNVELWALVGSFALLQGSISASQSLINNLFIRQTNAAYLAGALGILHFFGRIFTSGASFAVSLYNMHGVILFSIPSLSLLILSFGILIWSRYSAKISNSSMAGKQ